ncbi:MAG: DUF6712 family protein [Muribaculaceae bacterium]
MAKLITNDDTLRQYLPNMFATVKGEVSLFDKVKVDINLAENWVIETFVSTNTFNTICGYAEDNPIKIITAKLIATEVLSWAIPSLDLVLTPNGFGVVSTQNIAPASKERVDRLIGSLADYRDECIGNILPALGGESQWLTSSQALFFGETLFPDLAITDQVKGTGSKWERYLALRPKILDIEASLAEEFFSPELMVRLRNEVLRKTHTADLARVINAIRGQVVDLLNGGLIRMRDMIDVVNHIRCYPDLFPEWHASETAKLFSPPIFTNLKTNKGYWF